MAEHVGTVSVQIVPDVTEFKEKLRASLLPDMTVTETVTETYEHDGDGRLIRLVRVTTLASESVESIVHKAVDRAAALVEQGQRTRRRA